MDAAEALQRAVGSVDALAAVDAAQALARAVAGVDALAVVEVAELDPAELGEFVVGLHRLGDRLSGITHRAVAVQGRTAAWRGQGARSHKQWLAQRCRLSPGEAASRARTAQRLEALPETAEALADGRIGAGHARVAAQAAADLPPEAAAGLDQLVVQTGSDVDAARLRTAVDAYAHRTAPESLAERERRAWESRRLSVSRTAEGGVALDGRLDVLGGETVVTALAALSAPRGADDDRSAEQRHADALVTLSRQALDQGELPIVGAVRPHVTVVVPLETVQTARTGTGAATETGTAQDPVAQPGVGGGPAMLDRLGAISGEAARMLACDAGIVRVITAGASQPLDAGRETRVVSPAQRRALAVRDRGCIGCAAPVGWCEAHHVTHWFDWGDTDLDNLVLVCGGCHRDIHDRGWKPVRGPDGHWSLHPPSQTQSPPRPKSPGPPCPPGPRSPQPPPGPHPGKTQPAHRQPAPVAFREQAAAYRTAGEESLSDMPAVSISPTRDPASLDAAPRPAAGRAWPGLPPA
ncbi:MAG: DUF222 domain-containing protein [Nitriliruptorales bacterium]|nr:DUF222 domain-containing protein [Nitriliruptorales bacterium]